MQGRLPRLGRRAASGIAVVLASGNRVERKSRWPRNPPGEGENQAAVPRETLSRSTGRLSVDGRLSCSLRRRPTTRPTTQTAAFPPLTKARGRHARAGIGDQLIARPPTPLRWTTCGSGGLGRLGSRDGQRKHARTGRASHYCRSSVRAGVLGGRAETLVGEGAVDVRVVGDGAQAEVLRGGQVDRGRPEGARCSARRPAADRASSCRRRSSGTGRRSIRRAPASAATSWEEAGPETPARRARSEPT